MSIKKWMTGALIAACLAGTSYSADLSVEGLGTFPLSDEITLSDAGGTYLENLIKKGESQPAYGTTARAFVASLLDVPPGINLFPEKGPFPAESLHLYQISKKELTGDYTAVIRVYSGTEDELFQSVPPKIKSFWTNEAFKEGTLRPVGLFGSPTIKSSDFQKMINEVTKKYRGNQDHIEVLKVSPWQPVADPSGRVRWEQTSKVVVTNEKNLSYPEWNVSSFYKSGNRYYLVIVTGSHASEDVLSEDIEKAANGLQRK
jgi:hypothetical protein